MREIADEILAIEKGFWTRVDDPRFFQENLAEEGISVIEPMGFIEERQAVQMMRLALTAHQPWKPAEETAA